MSCKITWPRLLAALLVLASPLMATADDYDSVFGDHWGFRIGLNYSSWPGLGDLEPAGTAGPFETKGNGLEFEGYTSIAKLGDNWLFAGLDVGSLGFNTSLLEDDFPDESALDLTHVTALLKYRFGDPGHNYFEIDLGLGWYLASTMYIQCHVIPDCFDAEADVDTVGGFVGISGRLFKNLVVGARANYADFGTIDAIGPNSGNLKGPIYTAYVSLEFGRW